MDEPRSPSPHGEKPAPTEAGPPGLMWEAELTEADYVEAYRRAIQRVGGSLGGVAFVALGAISLLTAFAFGAWPLGAWSLLLLALPPIFLFHRGLPNRVGKLAFGSVHSKLRRRQFSVESDGLREVNANYRGHFRWSEFDRWEESANVILLFESNRLVRVVPKRGLADEGLEELRDHLEKYIEHRPESAAKRARIARGRAILFLLLCLIGVLLVAIRVLRGLGGA